VSKFLDSLNTTEISDSIFAIADHPFRYESDLAKKTFTVPVGFFTDFASVPRLGIIYAMLGDRAHEPAVVHDWLYYAAVTTRAMADDVLMEAMARKYLPWWQRYPIWWGVRAGGWLAWNTHRKAGHPEVGKFADSPDILGKSVMPKP
jgi:Protein of unknown function (DUF1353)